MQILCLRVNNFEGANLFVSLSLSERLRSLLLVIII